MKMLILQAIFCKLLKSSGKGLLIMYLMMRKNSYLWEFNGLVIYHYSSSAQNCLYTIWKRKKISSKCDSSTQNICSVILVGHIFNKSTLRAAKFNFERIAWHLHKVFNHRTVNGYLKKNILKIPKTEIFKGCLEFKINKNTSDAKHENRLF